MEIKTTRTVYDKKLEGFSINILLDEEDSEDSKTLTKLYEHVDSVIKNIAEANDYSIEDEITYIVNQAFQNI